MKRTPLLRRTPLADLGKRRGRARSLRQKLLPLFSKLIRQRDKQCLMASSGLGKCGGNLQCSHIYPRGKYPLLALFPLDAFACCFVHHLYVWHRNPVEAHRWMLSTFPQDWLDRLEAARTNSVSRKGMTESQVYSEWRMFGLMK